MQEKIPGGAGREVEVEVGPGRGRAGETGVEGATAPETGTEISIEMVAVVEIETGIYRDRER